MSMPVYNRRDFAEKFKDEILTDIRETATIADLEGFSPSLIAIVMKLVRVAPGKNAIRIVICEVSWQDLIERYNAPLDIPFLDLVKKEITDPIAGVFGVSMGKSFMVPEKPSSESDMGQLRARFDSDEDFGTPSFIITYDDVTGDRFLWALPYDIEEEKIIFYKDHFINQSSVLDIKYTKKY